MKAVFIAVIATPPLRWMRGIGVPKWGALLVITFVLLDIGSLLALLEPLMILFMGCTVGYIVIAILLRFVNIRKEL